MRCSYSDGQRTAAGMDRQFVRADGHRDRRDDRDNKIDTVRHKRRHGFGTCRHDRERVNSRVLGHEREVFTQERHAYESSQNSLFPRGSFLHIVLPQVRLHLISLIPFSK